MVKSVTLCFLARLRLRLAIKSIQVVNYTVDHVSHTDIVTLFLIFK